MGQTDRHILNQPNQKLLFDKIAERLPENISLVIEVAELLDLSNDSAYRRLRGETELSYSETIKLCTHFQIPLDALNDSPMDAIHFVYHEYSDSIESFSNYLIGLSEELRQIAESKSDQSHLTFIGPGIPVLHFFKYPILNAFKVFYWMKSMNLDDRSYQFDPQSIDKQLLEIGDSIYDHYARISSTEVWTDSSVLGVVHQIRYCWDSGLIASQDIALEVCEGFRSMLATIEQSASKGKKTYVNDNMNMQGGDYLLYYSELEDENTCVLVETEIESAVYLGHLNHRFIKTVNGSYFNTTKSWCEHLKKRSVLISNSASSTSYQFFKRGNDKIAALEDHIRS